MTFGGILKLPENLLSKGKQNGETSLKLSRVILASRYLASFPVFACLNDVIDWTESQQLVTYGLSRKQFIKVIEKQLDQESKFFSKNKEE